MGRAASGCDMFGGLVEQSWQQRADWNNFFFLREKITCGAVLVTLRSLCDYVIEMLRAAPLPAVGPATSAAVVRRRCLLYVSRDVRSWLCLR